MKSGVETISNRTTGRLAAAATLAIYLMFVGGCTGLEPAMIGAASSGLQTGASATKWGKVNVVFHASKDEVTGAVQTVVEQLGLKLAKTKANKDGKRTQFILRNDRGDKYEITVRALADRMIAMKINVGWFGSSPAANLLVKRIRSVLFGNGVIEDVDDGDFSSS